MNWSRKVRVFLEGCASLFDFSGELYHSKVKEILGRDIDQIRFDSDSDAFEIDANAIRGDWARVGEDIENAIKKFKEENK